MEAGDSFSGSTMKNINMSIDWKGDWLSFKRRMTSVGYFSDVQQATDEGEKAALISKTDSTQSGEPEENKMTNKLKNQSERLAHMLLLTLESTRGTQPSIVVNQTRENRSNGIDMWVDLIRHSEKGSSEVRMSVLHKDWESSKFMDNEHPNDLYGRLIHINGQLDGLGAGYNEQQLKMRFVAAVEKEVNQMYEAVILQYRGTQFGGAGWSLEALIELLSHVYETKSNKIKSCMPEMKGLVVDRSACSHCGGGQT